MPRKTSAVAGRTIGQPAVFRKTEPEPVEEANPKVKKTFHLDTETVKIMIKMQYDGIDATGRKPSLSELVEEGIRLLAEQRTEDRSESAAAS